MFAFFKGYTNKAPEEYKMFLVMSEMGWDWWTYHEQPDDWIDTVELIITTRNQNLTQK